MPIAIKSLEAEVIKQDKPALVLFYKSEDPDCKKVIDAIEKFEKYFHGIIFAAVEVENDAKFPEQFGVYSEPVILLFQEGELKARGLAKINPLDTIRQLLEQVDKGIN